MSDGGGAGGGSGGGIRGNLDSSTGDLSFGSMSSKFSDNRTRVLTLVISDRVWLAQRYDPFSFFFLHPPLSIPRSQEKSAVFATPRLCLQPFLCARTMRDTMDSVADSHCHVHMSEVVLGQ